MNEKERLSGVKNFIECLLSARCLLKNMFQLKFGDRKRTIHEKGKEKIAEFSYENGQQIKI